MMQTNLEPPSKVLKTFKDSKLHQNCVGKCSQEQLLEMLSLLYQNLLAGNPNTEEYKVEYKHVIVEDLTNKIQKDAFSMMCVDAAGIKLQCGMEYGFKDIATQEMEPHHSII